MKLVTYGYFLGTCIALSPQLAVADSLVLPYAQPQAYSGTLFSITNTGTGAAASFNKLGVGTDSVTEGLTVNTGVMIDQADNNQGTLDNGLKFGGVDVWRVVAGHPATPPTTGEGIASKRTTGGNQGGLDFYTDKIARISITHAGMVGIGTPQPTRALEIDNGGDVELALRSTDANVGRIWTMQSSGAKSGTLAGTFQIVDRTIGKSRLRIDAAGTVGVNVLEIDGGSDLSEPFVVAADNAIAGSVVSIDEHNAGQLKLTTHAYDTRVAGIVSGANGVNPGIVLKQRAVLDDGHNIALSGRVYALADATGAAIEPGDLLTSSSTPGRLMKATDRSRSQGAIIGKAMSALPAGEGLVLVLVSLQ
jgi:hypothetical protein